MHVPLPQPVAVQMQNYLLPVNFIDEFPAPRNLSVPLPAETIQEINAFEQVANDINPASYASVSADIEQKESINSILAMGGAAEAPKSNEDISPPSYEESKSHALSHI